MLSDCFTFYILIFLLIFGNVKNDCFDLIGGMAVYTGTTSVTETGRVCQRWDSQVPHLHPYCCDKVTSADQNYCRNPDGWDKTWCITSDPAKEWEACAVPNCGDTTTTTSTTTTSTTTPTTTELSTDSTTTKPSTPTTTESTTDSITTKSTTVPTTTKSTYQPDAITTTSNLCQCPCTDRKQFWFTFHYGNLTDEEKHQIIYQEQQRLRQELLVDINYLSSYRRQKISADDQRTSAESIGKVGAAILVVIVSFIVINDVISLCRQIYSCCKNSKIHRCI